VLSPDGWSRWADRPERGLRFLRPQGLSDRAGLSRILAVVGKTRPERASCAAALAFANFVQNGSSSKRLCLSGSWPEAFGPTATGACSRASCCRKRRPSPILSGVGSGRTCGRRNRSTRRRSPARSLAPSETGRLPPGGFSKLVRALHGGRPPSWTREKPMNPRLYRRRLERILAELPPR
jgi:hypothetical protein